MFKKKLKLMKNIYIVSTTKWLFYSFVALAYCYSEICPVSCFTRTELYLKCTGLQCKINAFNRVTRDPKLKKYKKENSDFDLKVPTNCLPIETIASLIYGLQYKLNETKYKEDVTNFRNVLDSICEEMCKDKDNNVIDVLPVFHYIGNKLIQLTHDIIKNISSFIDIYKEKPK